MSTSSTNAAREAAALLFRERLLPAYREERGQPVPLQADPDLASYFVPASPDPRGVFELPACDSPEAFGRGVAELWRGRGLRRLADCEMEMAALAARFRRRDGDQSPELPHFVYAMY